MRMEDLKYFVHVADSHSIHKTADEFYRSPQSLSKILKGIEKELGVRLLIRSHEGVSLSADGEKFLEAARLITEEYDRVTRDFGGGASKPRVLRGSVKVLAQPRMLDVFVYDAVNAFHKENPHSTLTVKTFRPLEIIEHISRREAHIGVITISETYNNESFQVFLSQKRLRYTLLSSEPVFVCLHKKSKWALLQAFTREDFNGIPQIYFNNDLLLPGEASHGSDARNFEINSIATMKNMVADMKGVATITQREYRRFFSRNKNLILRSTPYPYTFQYGYVSPADSTPMPESDSFTSILKRTLGKPSWNMDSGTSPE
ncbi:MAG: LysR family transcriptional regulator [Gracilibacteraceae bacterium]|jgi:DNA-binding transcriptional LysR family regulator|nr:LysR family transcriptional regulator [Gracilibacteraceae bacterium]